MDKKIVLIASVLKPVNEPRMYKKIGLSLAEFSNLEIHIAGFKTQNDVSDKKITFHPLYDFNRLSPGRFSASKKFKILLQRIKPEILIVCTFELLKTAVEYKNSYPCLLIYDIRENHALNIRELGVYPYPINIFLSNFIKGLEKREAKWVDHFLLAEKCYEDEIDFIKQSFTIIENKYQGDLISKNEKSQEVMHFAFTGTAHQSTGVFRALDFVNDLNKLGLNVDLHICAHATQEKVYSKLKSLTFPWLHLQISRQAIDNIDILKTYQKCDLVLAPYIISQQNEHKFPTKIYDALANGIPVILSQNKYWMKNINSKSPVLNYDFSQAPKYDTIEKINALFNINYRDKSALWQTEKDKLKSLFQFLDIS